MKMLVAVAFILFISTAVAVAPPSYNHHEFGGVLYHRPGYVVNDDKVIERSKSKVF